MIRFKRVAIAFGVVASIVAVASATPIIAVEASCGRGVQLDRASLPPLADDPGYRRAEGDSYLTYPEWYIVHAYADLAGVTRGSSESRFDYAQSITTFWTSLCHATAAARAAGPVTADQRTTNYVIGLSFTLEMALQGVYERTVGAATAWSRGADKTPEDAFNQRFLDDYAAFLNQTPWYRYPFKAELARFWRETPWSSRSPLRSLERRFSLTLEYGFKGLYAVVIGGLAGYAPADLTIGTVVKGPLSPTVSDVVPVRELGNSLRLVRTPRYEAYTDILRAWSKNGTEVVEIAGNHRILTTVVARIGFPLDLAGAIAIFTVPIQSRPGWQRLGLDTKVSSLMTMIPATERQGATFEHAYDY